MDDNEVALVLPEPRALALLEESAACRSWNAIPSRDDRGTMIIHYYPFHLTSYTSISTQNIEGLAMCRIGVQVSSEIGKTVKDLLSAGRPGDFQSDFVRMKIELTDHAAIYVDVEGGILVMPEGNSQLLSLNDFEALQRLLDSAPEFAPCRDWE